MFKTFTPSVTMKLVYSLLLASALFAASSNAQNPPQMIPVAPGWSNVTVLFTVGQTIGGYSPTGILDGMGAYQFNATTVRMLVNSEIGPTVGYNYTLPGFAANATLTGARIHYVDVDRTSLAVTAAGLAYDSIYNRQGVLVKTASDLETGRGLARFCSAAFYPKGGVYGLVDNIFFTGEESAQGSLFALDVDNSDLWAAPWLGRAGT